jgi:hypothetical protein
MSEESLIKKLEEINSLLKALGQISNLAPSLRIPAPSIPKPKMISSAAKNLKNPVKQAQQVKDPNVKAYAMQQASLQNKAQHNQLAFKSEDSAMFYAFKDGKRLNSDPMTKENIHTHFGQDVELKPIVVEKLILSPNGQWKLEDK